MMLRAMPAAIAIILYGRQSRLISLNVDVLVVFDGVTWRFFIQFASEVDMAAMGAPGVRLITAASDGDKKGVKKWLDKGVDVDSRDWDKLTPLIAASSQGHLVRPMLIELRQQHLVVSRSRDSGIALRKQKCIPGTSYGLEW